MINGLAIAEPGKRAEPLASRVLKPLLDCIVSRLLLARAFARTVKDYPSATEGHQAVFIPVGDA